MSLNFRLPTGLVWFMLLLFSPLTYSTNKHHNGSPHTHNNKQQSYTGERLRHTLDWSLSSVGDDVTSYTGHLTEMERRLFQCGAVAATAHLRWRVFGKRRWLLRSPPPSTSTATATPGDKRPTRAVSPDADVDAVRETNERSNKRQRQ